MSFKHLLPFLALLYAMTTPIMAEETQQGTRIMLSVTVSQNVRNDELIVAYRIDHQGRYAKKLQSKVNQIVAQITQRLTSEDVKHSTTNRRLSPVWNAGFFSTQTWQLSQSGKITTQDLDAVPHWLGDIEQSGVQLNRLQFRVSDQTRKSIEEALQIKAALAFRKKAAVFAKGLAATQYRILRLNTDANVQAPHEQLTEHMVRKSAYSAPTVHAGESHISVTLSGTVEIPFQDFKLSTATLQH